MSISFRSTAAFGKRIEFRVVGRMLKEGLDVYLPPAGMPRIASAGTSPPPSKGKVAISPSAFCGAWHCT